MKLKKQSVELKLEECKRTKNHKIKPTPKMFKLISIDNEKEFISGYSPKNAKHFHEQSAKLANKKFDQALGKIKNQNKKVVLMCGGSAVGKTEFIERFLSSTSKDSDDFEGIVFESTLSSQIGVETKIRKIIKSGNKPIIFFIVPDSLKRCFVAFKNRERKIPTNRFFETHSGSRQTVLWVANNYSEVEINICQNKLVDNCIRSDNFERLFFSNSQNINVNNFELEYYLTKFKNREEQIDFLKSIQMTVQEIKKICG